MTQPATPPFLTTLAHHAADPFRLLVESVVEYAIFMVDPAGNVASWNPGAERIYGYGATEIIGQPCASFFTAEEVSDNQPQAALDLAREYGQCVQEGLRVRKDGSQFWAEVTSSNLKDYFGSDAGFSIVTRDVTERKDALLAVRRERDFSAAILASLPGVFYVCNQQGRLVRWNRRLEQVSEYTSEEIAALEPQDFFDAADKEVVRAGIGRVFQTGASEVEAHVVSKSGRRTPYYFSGVLATLDGQPFLLGMGVDLSAYKQAERELRATDERLRQAATAANIGLWDWDLRTNSIFYSVEWKRHLGYEDHEISNAPDEWERRLHPDDRDRAVKRLREFVANPSAPYAIEFRMRHRDGTYRTILSHGTLVFDEVNRPVRMLGSHIDITDQRRAETERVQSQKLEAVGLLAGGVAHDFNNLLTIINGYASLALEIVPANDPVRESIVEIKAAGDHASDLTKRLLAFSRQQVLEPRVLDLNAIVADTESMLRRLIGEHILLSTSLDRSMGVVAVDPGQIEQVLVNLAVNARDAMPSGGQLTIETHGTSLDETYCRNVPGLAPGEYVMLAVTDTGLGMDARLQSRIFEPFFTTKDLGKGTGLGLSTVHGIVKQSKGHIAVYSEPGHGTTFKIYLPRVEDERETVRAESRRPGVPTGTETILLVEDDQSVRALARQILSRCGYTVVEATDGQQALALASAHSGTIALLVTDVVMPHLGGRALADQLTAVRPKCKVLFLSGYARDAVNRRGELDTGHAFLQKPFTPAALAQKVRSVLDGRS
jgi:PAS domain S-box-containing protein